MAYANAHVKVTLFGTSCLGAEEWSTGFRMGSEDSGSGNFGIGDGFVNALLPLWQTFWSTTAHGVNASWLTTGIKAALILPDGKTDLANVVTVPYATPIAGGGATSPIPPQVSLVAQLAAASPIGLGSKGRMYLPGIGHTVQTSGKLTAAQTLAIANGLRTFLDAAESATNSPGYVINASKGRPGVPFTAPVNRRVTTIRVGDVYDTQRRRRNGLQESYSSASMAA
jgi:hypothetical protein